MPFANSAAGWVCNAGGRYLQPGLRRRGGANLDTLARLKDEMDDPALHIADARYQCIAAICDVVSNTLTKPNPVSHRGGR